MQLSKLNADLSFDLAILAATRPEEYTKQITWFVSEIGDAPWSIDDPIFFEKSKQFFERIIHPMVLDILSAPEGELALKNTISKDQLDKLVENFEAHKKELDGRVKGEIPTVVEAYIRQLRIKLAQPIDETTALELRAYLTREITIIVASHVDPKRIEKEAGELFIHAPTLGTPQPLPVPNDEAIQLSRTVLAQTELLKEARARMQESTVFEKALVFAPGDPGVAILAADIAAEHPDAPFAEVFLTAKKVVLANQRLTETKAETTTKPESLLRVFAQLANKEGTLTGGKKFIAALADTTSVIFPGFGQQLNTSFITKILKHAQGVTTSDVGATKAAATNIFSGASRLVTDMTTAVFGPQIYEVATIYTHVSTARVSYPVYFPQPTTAPMGAMGSVGQFIHLVQTTEQIGDAFAFLKGMLPSSAADLARVGAAKLGQTAVGSAVGVAAKTGFRAFLGKLFGGAIGRILGGAALGTLFGPGIGTVVGAIAGALVSGPVLKLVGRAGSWLMEKISTGGFIGGVGAAVSGVGAYVQNFFGNRPVQPTKFFGIKAEGATLLAAGVILLALAPNMLFVQQIFQSYRTAPLAIGGGKTEDTAPVPQYPFTPCMGGCLWPTTGTITQGPYLPYSRRVSHKGEAANAIDIGTTYLTPVRSPLDGSVISPSGFNASFGYYNGCLDNTGYIGNRCNRGYGNTMVIRSTDGSVEILFGHLSRNSMLAVGTLVSRGAIVALVDHNGNSSAAHLHYQVLSPQHINSFVPFEVPACFDNCCEDIQTKHKGAFSCQVSSN